MFPQLFPKRKAFDISQVVFLNIPNLERSCEVTLPFSMSISYAEFSTGLRVVTNWFKDRDESCSFGRHFLFQRFLPLHRSGRGRSLARLWLSSDWNVLRRLSTVLVLTSTAAGCFSAETEDGFPLKRGESETSESTLRGLQSTSFSSLTNNIDPDEHKCKWSPRTRLWSWLVDDCSRHDPTALRRRLHASWIWNSKYRYERCYPLRHVMSCCCWR